jgi:hypothetical protein
MSDNKKIVAEQRLSGMSPTGFRCVCSLALASTSGCESPDQWPAVLAYRAA